MMGIIGPESAGAAEAAMSEPVPDIAPEQFDRRRLSSSSTVMASTIWNLLGRAGPMVIAILVTPMLIHLLGVARWGVFSTALAMIGMFGVFDFGIGRALTRLLAELVGSGEDAKAASLVKTGILLLAFVGAVVGLVTFGLVFAWTHLMMTVPVEIRGEVTLSLYVVCLAIPLVTLGGALYGVMSAFQKFRVANIAGLPIISFYYLGPLAAAYLTNSLVWMMVSLLLVRVALAVLYGAICLHTMPSLRTGIFDGRLIGSLLRIGGWMTVSNITFPILTYCDRLVLISVLSASAAGYYSTPADMVSRFFIIVNAVLASAFPAVAACYRVDPNNAVHLFRRSVLMVVMWLATPCIVASTFSHELLTWWIGTTYASHAAPVFRLLCFGVMLGGADQVVASFLDSIGRPSVNAKFSIVELFVYIPILAIMLREFGIEGGAVAWVARASIDFVLRLSLACRLFPALRKAIPDVVKTLAFATLCLGVPLFSTGFSVKFALAVLSLFMIIGYVWLFTFSGDEKNFVIRKLIRVRTALSR